MKKDLRMSKQQTVPQPGFVPSVLAVAGKAIAGSMVLRVLLGVGLVFVSAQIQIPLKPVPITLQTVAVLILSLCYKKKEAVRAIVGYVAFGAMGLPMFAGLRAGIPVLLGTTGGYLFGMILCVYVITTLREKFGEDTGSKLMAYSFVGSVCVYLLGIPQLALFVGLKKAFQLGLFPFMISGTLKAMFTAACVRLLRQDVKWKK